MSTSIAVRVELLDTWLQTWVEANTIPGAALGIFDANGNELYYGATGYSRDSIYRIYSMTKPIVTVAAMILVERGQLSVDDELSKYIPSFKDIKVVTGGTAENPVLECPKRPITIKHLLTHTSGITYGIFGNSLSDQILNNLVGLESKAKWYSDLTTAELSEYCAKTPLAFHPGEHFLYGLNTDILGRVIEIISGTTLDVFLKSEIFDPLDMSDTSFQVSPEKAHRLVDLFELQPGLKYRSSTNPEADRLHNRVLLSGGGGLVSTMSDYSKFSCCLLNGGVYKDRRIISEDTLREITSNQLPGGEELAEVSFDSSFTETTGGGVGFGYGVSVIVHPAGVQGGRLSSVGEYAWGGVAGTYFFNDPCRKLSVIYMTQLVASAKIYPIRQQLRFISRFALTNSET